MAASSRKRNDGWKLIPGSRATGEIQQIYDRHEFFHVFRPGRTLAMAANVDNLSEQEEADSITMLDFELAQSCSPGLQSSWRVDGGVAMALTLELTPVHVHT